MLRYQSKLTTLLTALLLSAAAFAQLPMASRPEDVGFSSKRLATFRQVIKGNVEGKRVPGAVLIIVRNGKMVTDDAIGYQERAAQTPMKKDSIFRIASMSKPITTVAAMILAEENKLDVGAPVAQYLPEFKDVKVGTEGAAPKRPMTVQDLMRHTSGLTYGLFGNTPVDQMYRKANIFGAKSLTEMVKTIATMPLLHQPGEAWEYSVSTDVLGRVVEVASGTDLDNFVQERITGPLKMNDTGFWVKPSAIARLAKPDAQSNLPFADPTQRPAILSGGGGMFSTAGDYARFSQMLLNGGELDGVRILSPKTVALMTSDQLPATTERHTSVAMLLGCFGPVPEMGTGFGLGFAVRVDPGRNPVPGSVGDFSWGGITGTFFWVDPKEKLVAVLMVQAPQAMNGVIWRQTRTMVYQAMTN
ncbi:MAG TPA: serine hydrolase domain-containing protein [Bryobacteraceae bacterium]|nr:serine hydrolase domain-containing protein [Bryobacteraceae bacterium]